MHRPIPFVCNHIIFFKIALAATLSSFKSTAKISKFLTRMTSNTNDSITAIEDDSQPIDEPKITVLTLARKCPNLRRGRR